MSKVLGWENNRAVGPDGVVYWLNSEDTAGRHGARMWNVFVFETPAAEVTRILEPEDQYPDLWPTKARARGVAERDAQQRLTKEVQ